MARNPIHANLPRYEGLGTATKERDIVAALTDWPERFVNYLDDNVAAHLPPGSRVTALIPHGAAYWTRTVMIRTEQSDSSPLDFFLKVTHTEVGGVNVRGEYTSMTAISQALPDFCPVPIAVGTYASDPSVHFFLMSFADMTDEVPEPDSLAAKLAELHMKGTSPNGKFGFPVPTNTGALTHPNAWTSSWETFFSGLMRRNFHWEQQMHGHHEEMKQLFDALVVKVIPRLLRPLETGGNEITPCIVHGDLWDGNASTDASTDKPIIFDASSMYAHNEYELGAWNLPRHQIYKMYIRAYQRHFPISSPEEDCDDRLLLYRLRFDLTSSGCYLDNLRFRNLYVFPPEFVLRKRSDEADVAGRAIEDLRYLVTKYPNGYEGTEACKSETQ